MAFPGFSFGPVSINDPATTSHTFTMPAGVQAGEQLLLLVSFDDGLGGIDITAGLEDWTALSAWMVSGSQAIRAYYKFAVGGEGDVTCTSNNNEESIGIIARCTDANATSPPELASATGNSNSPDPPNLSASWGSEATAWVAFYGQDAGPVSPTTYSLPDNQFAGQSSPAGGNVGMAVSTIESGTVAFDPRPYLSSATQPWSTFTIAVRGVEVVTPEPDKHNLILPDRYAPGFRRPTALPTLRTHQRMRTDFTASTTDVGRDYANLQRLGSFDDMRTTFAGAPNRATSVASPTAYAGVGGLTPVSKDGAWIEVELETDLVAGFMRGGILLYEGRDTGYFLATRLSDDGDGDWEFYRFTGDVTNPGPILATWPSPIGTGPFAMRLQIVRGHASVFYSPGRQGISGQYQLRTDWRLLGTKYVHDIAQEFIPAMSLRAFSTYGNQGFWWFRYGELKPARPPLYSIPSAASTQAQTLQLPDRYAPGWRGDFIKPSGRIELDFSHTLAPHVMFAATFTEGHTSNIEDSAGHSLTQAIDLANQNIPDVVSTTVFQGMEYLGVSTVGDRKTTCAWRQTITENNRSEEWGLTYPKISQYDRAEDSNHVLMIARARWSGIRASGGERIVGQSPTGGGNEEFAIFTGGSGQPADAVFRVGGSDVVIDNIINPGEWYTWVGGQDGGGKFGFIYHDDGRLLGSGSSGTSSIDPSVEPIAIGHRLNERRYWSGDIDYAIILDSQVNGRVIGPQLVQSGIWQLFKPVRPPLYIVPGEAPGPGGSGSFAGSSAFSSDGRIVKFGSGAFAGTAAVQADGRIETPAQPGSGSFTGTSAFQADGILTKFSAGTFSGTSAVSADGRRIKRGTGSFAGTATMQADGRVSTGTSGSFAGASTFQADGRLIRVYRDNADFAAASAFQADGRIGGAQPGAGTFAGASAFSAAGRQLFRSTGVFAGSSIWSGNGIIPSQTIGPIDKPGLQSGSPQAGLVSKSPQRGVIGSQGGL